MSDWVFVVTGALGVGVVMVSILIGDLFGALAGLAIVIGSLLLLDESSS